jgi:uncharacterized integral membrane protein
MRHKRNNDRNGEGGDHRGARGGRFLVRLVLLIVVILVAIVLSRNTGQISIDLLYDEVTMPLWAALLGTGVIGLIVGSGWGGRR